MYRGARGELIKFFEDFWAFNGPDHPSEYDRKAGVRGRRYRDGYGRFVQTSLEHGQEIVLPPEGNKPFLIIRGHYAVTDQCSRYTILTMPETAGPLKELVRVESGRVLTVALHGEILIEEAWKPSSSYVPGLIDVSQYWTAIYKEESRAMQTVLWQSIALLDDTAVALEDGSVGREI